MSKLLQDFGHATVASSHLPFEQVRVFTGGPSSHSQNQFGQSSPTWQLGALLAGVVDVPEEPDVLPLELDAPLDVPGPLDPDDVSPLDVPPPLEDEDDEEAPSSGAPPPEHAVSA